MEQSRGAKTRTPKEDRISALTDHILHHILSFLPSTKEAIRTSILSKRWRNQWTRVRVLIFDDTGKFNSEDLARFIDSALLQHQCSKIKKLQLCFNFEKDTNFSSKIRFATTRHVEELILNCYFDDIGDGYLLPKFLFDNASLLKLELHDCDFIDDWTINLESLKVFKMNGCCRKVLVANVLDGSPSLESLHLNENGSQGSAFAIASTSLKILILEEISISDATRIELSCPNLEEFSIQSSGECTELHETVVENVVSGCPFLRLLVLECCWFEEKLFIASKYLKKLVLRRIISSLEIEISCPNLEEFNSSGSHKLTFNLMNNFETSQDGGCHEDKAKQIFMQLRSVDELTIDSWFIKILSNVEMRSRSYRWLQNKILTLDGPNFEHPNGIVCALRSSPALQRLVIKLQVYERRLDSDLLDLSDSSGSDWNSNGTVIKCLLSHLKIVEIVGLSKQDAKCKSVLKFIGFLLKNARVLEKLVLVISKDDGKDFAFEVFQKVSSFTRCSQHAAVELLYS